MLRETLLADAIKFVREHRERTTDAASERAPTSAVAMPPTVVTPPAARPLATWVARAPTTTHSPPINTPHPQPPTLLTRARAFLAHHLAEPPALLDTLILWSLHTHAHARFDVSPRLILHGRDPRADHARALRVLRWLTPSPRLVARATAATVLDLIAQESPTLLLDDAANAILARRDMRALIAAGAHADGALLTKRKNKDDGAVRSCAAPLAIATAVSPPDEMLTHAIVLPMSPALEREGRARDPIADPPAEALALRAEFESVAARLAATNATPAVTLPPFLDAAARETWTPLFTFAHELGPEAEAAARAAASQFASPEHLEPPTSARALLRDIRRIVGIDDAHPSSTQLVEALTREPDSPWNACDWGAKLTPRGVAQRLARFDVRPTVIYPRNAPAYRGYKAEALLVAFARYLADPVARALLRREP